MPNSRRIHAKETESDLRYRRLCEAVREGILILNATTGKIEEANPFMSELLTYSHDQLIGKHLWEIGLFHDIGEGKQALAILHETGHVRYKDLPLESKDAELREVEFVGNVYAVGNYKVIQCNLREVAPRQRMEQLQEQAAQLADAHRRKDKFLEMLSHELGDPRAPLMSAVQVLRLSAGNRLQKEATDAIERQVRHLARVANELLAGTRPASSKIHLRLELLSLNSLVEQAIETCQMMIDLHKLGLSVSLPQETIWVQGDAARLEQIVGHLLSNAIKYTGEKGHIWVTLRQEGHEAVLRVKDTGIGIAPQMLPCIFDLFAAHADESPDRPEAGMGIGLSLVKNLTAMHRGSVEARSAGLHQGSEFVLRLPAQTLTALAEPAEVGGAGGVKKADDESVGEQKLPMLPVAENAPTKGIIPPLYNDSFFSGLTAFEVPG